jgi:hypothetical protein
MEVDFARLFETLRGKPVPTESASKALDEAAMRERVLLHSRRRGAYRRRDKPPTDNSIA